MYASDKILFAIEMQSTVSIGRRHISNHQCFAVITAVIVIVVSTNGIDAVKTVLQPTHDVIDMQMHMTQNSTKEDVEPVASNKVLKRDKRFLIFMGGGIAKIVLGFLTPVETRDPVNWRTLNLAYNFQAQYVPVPAAKWWWTTFSRSLIDQRRRYDAGELVFKDSTRNLIYGAVEMFMNGRGKPGRQCLLKAICQVAEHPIETTSVFDQIVHLVLTPNEDEPDSDYMHAKNAGEFGADCASLYRVCKPTDGLLENISVFL